METAYGEANPVSAPFRNLAPFPNSSGIQTGGATYLPQRYYVLRSKSSKCSI